MWRVTGPGLQPLALAVLTSELRRSAGPLSGLGAGITVWTTALETCRTGGPGAPGTPPPVHWEVETARPRAGVAGGAGGVSHRAVGDQDTGVAQQNIRLIVPDTGHCENSSVCCEDTDQV